MFMPRTAMRALPSPSWQSQNLMRQKLAARNFALNIRARLKFLLRRRQNDLQFVALDLI